MTRSRELLVRAVITAVVFGALAGIWPKLAADWRMKQLQYTWLRAVTGDHTDFWAVTEDGLDWALEAQGLADPGLRDRLLGLLADDDLLTSGEEGLEELVTAPRDAVRVVEAVEPVSEPTGAGLIRGVDVAGDVERRQGDRVGLVLFGSRAYLQTPLTFDTETTAILLAESEIGLAGRETAIGDAIGLAVKRLREDAASDRVLVLLTDGANTSGEVQPMQATEFAAREGLRIYTVGVGADEMMVRDFFGSRVVNPSADLDEDTLRAIAERTGGAYFRARDAQALADIYRRLDELEPVESDQEVIRPIDELFHWPLGAAFLLVLGALGVAMLPGIQRVVAVR